MIKARIGIRLLLSYLLLSLLPFIATIFLLHQSARSTLEDAAFRTLRAVRESKKQQIESTFYFYAQFLKTLADSEATKTQVQSFSRAVKRLNQSPVTPQREEDLKLWYQEEYAQKLRILHEQSPMIENILPQSNAGWLLQWAYLAQNPNPSWQKFLLDRSGHLDEYDKIHSRIHPGFLDIRQRMRLRDVLLVDTGGTVVYSTEKLPDLGTSLQKGPWRDSSLGRVFRNALSNGSASEDFATFMPALSEQTAFIGYRIGTRENPLGCLIIQFSPEILNRIMSGNRKWREEQLGETGETYVVGPNYLMRNESRFSQEESTRLNNLLGLGENFQRLPDTNPGPSLILHVRTPAARAALSGESGTMIQVGYHGRHVLCAYTYVRLNTGTWAVIAEMELNEVLAPIHAFTGIVYQAGFLFLILIILLSIRVTNGITHPINLLSEAARRFSAGDFSSPLPQSGGDELGDLSRTFSHMRDNILSHRNSMEREMLERKQAEEDAHQSRMMLQTVLDQIPQAVYWKSGDILEGANMAWEDLSRRIGASALEQIQDLESQMLISNQNQLHQSLEIERDLSQKIYLEVSLLILPDAAGERRLLAAIHDMSAKIQMERQLQTHQKLESLGSIAGGIAHDFNNLLMAISGYIDIATRKPDQDPEHLQKALNACERAAGLSRQLLVFARGGTPIRRVLNLENTVREAVRLGLTGSSTQVNWQIAPQLPMVNADESQLHQAINNLAINSRQAMGDSGRIVVRMRSVHESLLPDEDQPRDYLMIELEDNGPGIPQEMHSRIFEPFYTTKTSGSGLGLATTFGIIKKHEGLILLKPDQPTGACFQIYLPASQLKALPEAEIPVKTDSIKGQGRILLLDDEPAILEVTGEFLKMLGYDACGVSNGLECVKTYQEAQEQKNPFDLVIMDLTIPGQGMGGRETARKILEINPNALLIVSSGYSDDEVMANHQKFGFCGVLQKPHKLDPLGRLIQSILGKPQ